VDTRVDVKGGQRLNPRTKIYLLIGDPVEKSLSPAMHNAAFKALGLNSVYIALRVPKKMLARMMTGVKAMAIAGLNVTVPHKITIIDMLDKIEESAKLAGAVNTIKNIKGKLVGFNTDGEGALQALEQKTGKLTGKKVVLLGAGGAARGIAFSLARAGAEISIANRTVSRARLLASAVEKSFGVSVKSLGLSRSELIKVIKQANVLINATTVGMYPNVGQTLVTADMMHRGLVVNDIVYKPLETRLLREAKRAGAKTVDGLGMLVHQGALSFEIWTGKRVPTKVMEAAARRELGGENR
jgi:shikimate dehydrogenase